MLISANDWKRRMRLPRNQLVAHPVHDAVCRNQREHFQHRHADRAFSATLPARRHSPDQAHMHVIDAKTELIAQYAGRTNVSGNHRFFDDTVGNATRLGDDIQHFTTENKAVIRAIFKHQQVVMTPLPPRRWQICASKRTCSAIASQAASHRYFPASQKPCHTPASA